MLIQQEKTHWRSATRTARQVFANGRETELAGLIADTLLSSSAAWGIAAGTRLAGYWPIGSEADIRPLMIRLHDQGVQCCLPVVIEPGKPLTFKEWRPGDELMEGPFGTRHPHSGKPEVMPEVMLVPGLAFDREGWRLGQGGGHYDRTIEELSGRDKLLTIGTGFSCQVIDAVPHGAGDVPMDALLTDEMAIKTKRE